MHLMDFAYLCIDDAQRVKQTVMTRKQKYRIFLTVLTVMFGAYYGIFAYYTPFVGDDMRFMREYMIYSNHQTGFIADAWWKFMTVLREVDNSRLCNAIYMSVRSTDSYAAKGIAAAIAAMMLCVGIILVYAKKPRPVMLFVCIVIILFPWRENTMACVNYMNTMLPSAFTLLFLYLMLFADIRTRPQMILTAVFSLLAGSIHEGYSAVVCVGMLVLLVMKRAKIPGRWWLFGLCYAAGMLFVATSPGILLRAVSRELPYVSVKGTLSMIMPACLTVATLAALVFSDCGRRHLRLIAGNSLFIICATAFILSGAIAVYTGLENPRALWIPCFFATIIWVMAAEPFLTRLPRGLFAAMLCVTTLFAVNQIRVQRIYKATNDEIEAEMSETPHGTVFRDYEVLMPRVNLMQPVKNVWFDCLHLLSVNFNRQHGKIYCVVAENLGSITKEQAMAINRHENPGEGFIPVKGKSGWWYYGDRIVAPDTMLVTRHWTGETERHVALSRFYDVIERKGESPRRNIPFLLQKFVTDSGDTLLWIHTQVRGMKGPFEEIR